MQGTPGVDSGIVDVWQKTTGSKNIIVGLVDTGVDVENPELKDNIVPGYDFCNERTDVSPEDRELEWHGTHTASLIGAVGNNGTGIAGVNWNVSIMPLKFMRGYKCDPRAKPGQPSYCANRSAACGTDDQSVPAIRYAVDHGARIINASWGGSEPYGPLYDAIKYARDHGVLFITTAGNSAMDNDSTAKGAVHRYPGGYDLDNIITVAAVDEHGNLWKGPNAVNDGSNWGAKTVHLGAPGTNMFTPKPNGSTHYSSTSSAAAFASGVAALVLSAHPEWDMKTLRDHLLNYTLPLPGLKGKTVTGGMINAKGAIEGVRPSLNIDVSQWPSRSVAVNATASGRDQRVNVAGDPGSKMVAVHFSNIQLASGDSILVMNGKGTPVEYIYGNQTDHTTPIVAGGGAIVTIMSRSGAQSSFTIDRVMSSK